MFCVLIRIAQAILMSTHNILLFISGAMINSKWLEQPMFKTKITWSRKCSSYGRSTVLVLAFTESLDYTNHTNHTLCAERSRSFSLVKANTCIC